LERAVRSGRIVPAPAGARHQECPGRHRCPFPDHPCVIRRSVLRCHSPALVANPQLHAPSHILSVVVRPVPGWEGKALNAWNRR